MVSLEVISLVYNRAEDVKQLLRSLEASHVKPARVWLIDNGSQVPLALDVSACSFPVEIRRIEKNRGIAGYNFGFELSRSRHVVAIDSDVTVAPETLGVFARAFETNTDLKLAGARILDATSKKPMWDNPVHGARELEGGGRYMVQFNGSCFAADREAFVSLGGFDQRLFIYVNEWDLTLKAFKAMRPEQIRYFPEAVAYHKTAPSTDRAKLYEVLTRRNEFWVRWKHYPLSSALDYSARFVGGSLKRLFSGESEEARLHLRYLKEGLLGLTWALRERKPLEHATFERLMSMREESGKAPENLAKSF